MTEKSVILFSDVRGRDGYASVFLPLSTLAVGTSLKAAGLNVTIVDAQVCPDWEEILRDLAAHEILFFGVSALTGPSLGTALDSVELIRSLSANTPVVWGGYHATHNYAALFSEGLADYVVRGPGEIAISGLVRALECPAPSDRAQLLEQIPNLAWRRADGSIGLTLQRKVNNMDEIPPLDYSLVNVEQYLAANGRVLHTITSYGCPHGCTFCVEPSQSLRRWRGLEAEVVVNRLQALAETHQPNVISIQDPNFSSNPGRVRDIVERLIELDLRLEFICDMRARDVIRLAELMPLDKLPLAGFKAIFLGLESGSDRVLKMLHKGSTSQDAWLACAALDEAGITTLTSFMHDIPGETKEDSQQTFVLLRRLGRLRRNNQRHHFFTPYPATPLFEQLAASDDTVTGRTQRQWAETGTYWGSSIWPGRTEFRRDVIRRLRALQRVFPHALQDSGLPQLERAGSASVSSGLSMTGTGGACL